MHLGWASFEEVKLFSSVALLLSTSVDNAEDLMTIIMLYAANQIVKCFPKV